MSEIMVIILAVSGLIIIVMTLMRSIARTKSSVRWVKGISFKDKKTEEEIFECVKRINHPAVTSVDYNAEGKIVVHTSMYDFPVEVTQNKEGNTTIGFIVNWIKMSKRKRKKIAFLFDELCLFLKHVVENKDLSEAMEVYEKNVKFAKIYKIVGTVLIVAFVLFILTSEM